MTTFLSCGVGRQTTTLLMMSIVGEFERPDYVIFADTQDEPKAVYRHLEWLMAQCEKAGIPFDVVTRGKLSTMLMRKLKRKCDACKSPQVTQFTTDKTYLRCLNCGSLSEWKGEKHFTSIPTFGKQGGIGRRQCTREMKVDPLTKKQRELLGYPPRVRIPVGSAEVWIGISLDEATRMKPSRERWATNRWPLIEKRMTLNDCLNWLTRHGFPIPPKSSCIFCPFHSDATWRKLKMEQPDEWAFAVDIDRQLNAIGEYLHKALVPLDQVDLSTPEDHGQLDLGFGNECEGHCGV